MNIHEYQAKEMINRYGIDVPIGFVATSVSEAVEAAKKVGGEQWAVKAQIHSSGRGKAQGVLIANSLAEVEKYAIDLLGIDIVTAQTGPEGKRVRKILVEKGYDFTHQYYIGLVLDRSNGMLTFLVSTGGGAFLEEKIRSGEYVTKAQVRFCVGYTPFIGRKLAYSLGFKGPLVSQFCNMVEGIYNLYTENDCTVVEINPFIVTSDQGIVALDSKICFDDNALFRNQKLEEFRDLDEESELEIEARKHNLDYVSLNGNIGIMVNGASLAMATSDIIKIAGGGPANFLDLGGSATQESVERAFSIILKNPEVEVILVNIFGGLVKCNVIAEGIVAAASNLEITIPIIVRLEGTNVALGRKILKDSKLNIIFALEMGEAVEKVLEASKK